MRTGMGTIAYYGDGPVDVDNNHSYLKNGKLPAEFTKMNGPGKAKDLNNSLSSIHSSETSEKIQLNGFSSSHSLSEYEEKNITISLQPGDKRFGFSVMGGSDEGLPPRIDVISEGSPASKTSLSVNDEIVEVNGSPIDDATHAEVIMQIHKCIQKRVINLTVRRYASEQIVPNYNHNYTPQSLGESTFRPGLGAIINEGFTREVSVDRELPSDGTGSQSQTVVSRHDPGQQTYTNPAFDEEEEPADHIESSPDGPRTLAYSSFLALIEHIKGKFVNSRDQEDLTFLRNVFNSDDFNLAVSSHNDLTKIQAARRIVDDMGPHATNSQFLLTEVRLSLLGISGDRAAAELLQLVNDAHIKGVLEAHDRIAMREALGNPFESDYSDEGSERDEDEVYDGEYDEKRVNVNVVIIDKTVDPLGATVRNDGNAVMISRIVKGGAAEKSGLLHEGDEILEINGNPVKGKNVNEVVELLSELDGTLTFVIVPGDKRSRSISDEASIFMRAQFDYDPHDDEYNPCQELGLRFRKGEILEILNKGDPDWWQARKVDDEYRGLANLIPSKSNQEQREARRITIPDQEELPSRQKRRCFCFKGKKKKPKKRNIMESGNPDSVDDILTYEEMVQVDPNPDLKRPIVLIGPPKVGRRELREKLIRSNPTRFAPAVPHTSRPMRPGEEDGKDFHFITQEDFEADISAQKFAEYGQSDGHFYGTSLDEIRAVANAKKVCVLNLHCQALPILKTSDIKPYVVFVTLPPFDQLRKFRGTSEGEPFNPNIRLRDEELMDVIDRAREMDINFAHYFDYTIVNRDLENAYVELSKVASYLETQPQWIPAAWIRT